MLYLHMSVNIHDKERGGGEGDIQRERELVRRGSGWRGGRDG